MRAPGTNHTWWPALAMRICQSTSSPYMKKLSSSRPMSFTTPLRTIKAAPQTQSTWRGLEWSQKLRKGVSACLCGQIMCATRFSISDRQVL
ncbi:hypothetical protein D3C72_2314120 [compost metagenome]